MSSCFDSSEQVLLEISEAIWIWIHLLSIKKELMNLYHLIISKRQNFDLVRLIFFFQSHAFQVFIKYLYYFRLQMDSTQDLQNRFSSLYQQSELIRTFFDQTPLRLRTLIHFLTSRVVLICHFFLLLSLVWQSLVCYF